MIKIARNTREGLAENAGRENAGRENAERENDGLTKK